MVISSKLVCLRKTHSLSLCNLVPVPGHTLHFSLTVRTPPSAVPHVVWCLLFRRSTRLTVQSPQSPSCYSSRVLSDQSSSHIVCPGRGYGTQLSHSGRNCQPPLLPVTAGHMQQIWGWEWGASKDDSAAQLEGLQNLREVGSRSGL